MVYLVSLLLGFAAVCKAPAMLETKAESDKSDFKCKDPLTLVKDLYRHRNDAVFICSNS